MLAIGGIMPIISVLSLEYNRKLTGAERLFDISQS